MVAHMPQRSGSKASDEEEMDSVDVIMMDSDMTGSRDREEKPPPSPTRRSEDLVGPGPDLDYGKPKFTCTFAGILGIIFGYKVDTETYGNAHVGWWTWSVPINPSSPFSQCWEFLSGLLLLYTTAVTPLLISFFSEEEGWCRRAPTLKMDMFVDSFFISEIILHFLTGRVHHGQYIFRFNEVVELYLQGTLPVDVITACPVAWLEFALVADQTCEEKRASPPDASGSFVQYMRLIRMLRMLRLLKVLKIFNVLRDLFRLRPTIIRLLKLAFTVVMIAHVGGCAWWFIKLQEGPEELRLFKEHENILYPIWSPYITSLYFMMATLCTVGYGDISADSDVERVFVTVVMLMGSAVFAIIVSNMSALVASIQVRFA